MKIQQISKFASPVNTRVEPKTSSSKFEDLNLNATKDFEAFASKKPKKEPKDLKISKYFDTKVPESHSTFTCPICCLDLTKSSDIERQSHVNQCLDKGYSSKPKKFGSKSEEDFKEPKVPSTKETKVSVKSEPKEPKEPKVADQSKPLEVTINDLIANCPICGKVLHSLNVFRFFVFDFFLL